MSKRNQKIVMTKEAKLLKKLRIDSDLSLRKLADLMNLSFTRVHQMESGREDVTEEYIDLFLMHLKISRESWGTHFGKDCSKNSLRVKCYQLLESIDEDKLELVYGILSNFS